MPDPVAPGGAVWCDQHGWYECTKTSKRSQARCHERAIKGLDRCRHHAGEKTSTAKARGAANLMRAAFAEIPASEYVDPGDVLLWSVTVCARQVEWLRGLIADRLTGTDRPAVDSEQLTALIKLEQEERTALTRAAKMALDAGIAERQVRLAERTAQQLVAVLRGVVEELGHDANDPAVAGIVRRHLTLVGGAAAAG